MDIRLGYIAGVISLIIAFFPENNWIKFAFAIVGIFAFIAAYIFHGINPLGRHKKSINESIKNLSALKDSIDAEYELHNKNILSENYDTICAKHAYLGFDMPTGALYDDIKKLYINEIAVFADIVLKTISKVITKENASALQPHLSKLVTEMMQSHNFRTKKEHENASTFDYPKPFVDNFSDMADKETELQEKKIISQSILNLP